MKPIRAKINVSKIDKAHLFKGKNGTYLDLVIWPNKQQSQYGDTHVVMQAIPKEARDAGEKEQIVGNLTMPDGDQQRATPSAQPQERRTPAQAPKPPRDPDLDCAPDDIPF